LGARAVAIQVHRQSRPKADRWIEAKYTGGLRRTAMRTTPMGATGLLVPGQGLGCMRMEARTDAGGSDAAAVINRALDLGVTLLDTADLYGNGRSERLVGQAVRSRRDEVVLCTKFGALRGADGALAFRADAAYVRAACDASLEGLGTDVIDLYYMHRRDVGVPIEETVGAMAGLVGAGKVRHLGLSEVAGDELRAAHAVYPIAAVQSEWSLCARRIEAMLPVCVELGVGVVPYCPQGAGLLSGAVDATERLAGIDPNYARLPELLEGVAQHHGVKPGQVALAWVQQRAEVWGLPVSPIPGTTRIAHLEENVAAADLVLSPDDLALLDVDTLLT
jgi:aryl-alcohol dehydrogenase-like predicted oxidoreductase